MLYFVLFEGLNMDIKAIFSYCITNWRDLTLHLSCGFMLQTCLSSLFGLQLTQGGATLMALFLTFVIAVGWELYALGFHQVKPDWKEAGAALVGALLSIAALVCR